MIARNVGESSSSSERIIKTARLAKAAAAERNRVMHGQRRQAARWPGGQSCTTRC